MLLKLKQSIRTSGNVQHRPPSVIDTEELGISQTEAEVLIRSGVAVIHEAEEAQTAPETPEVPESTEVIQINPEGEAKAEQPKQAKSKAKAKADSKE